MAGSQAGTVVAYPLSSALITSMGWESVFYVQSCITLVWCFAWFMLVADSPYVDTKITAAEKNYIITAIGDDKDRKVRKGEKGYMDFLYAKGGHCTTDLRLPDN